jgi:hypothetical protein
MRVAVARPNPTAHPLTRPPVNPPRDHMTDPRRITSSRRSSEHPCSPRDAMDADGRVAGLMGPTESDDDTSPSTYQVFVKNVDGQTLTFDVYDNFYVQSLKVLVWQATGTPPHSQRLIYKGRQVKDAMPLVTCGIMAGSTLDLTMSLSGGMPPRQQQKRHRDDDQPLALPNDQLAPLASKREMIRNMRRKLNANLLVIGVIDTSFIANISTEINTTLAAADANPDTALTSKVKRMLRNEKEVKELRSILKSTNNFLPKLNGAAKYLWTDFFDKIAAVKTQLNDIERAMRDTLDMLIAHEFADQRGMYQWQTLYDSLENLEKECVGIEAESRGELRGRASATASMAGSAGHGPHGGGSASASGGMEI